MLPNEFTWDNFKNSTKVKWRIGRGSNMADVDAALKLYWDAVARRHGVDQLAAAMALVKSCNTWLKKKKDKYHGGQGKQHFKTRWERITALGQASLDETLLLIGNHGGNQTGNLNGQREYEFRKFQSMKKQGPQLKGLHKGYDVERKMYLGSGKQQNPVSGTQVHETRDMLTNQNSISYNPDLGERLGNRKVLNRNFETLTVKDWQEMDGIMRECEGEVGAMARQVLYLNKRSRTPHLAIPTIGLLSKPDGNLWETGDWDEAYVMDEYGNLFIGVRELGTRDVRLNHSTLLAGKEVLCAGTVKVRGGTLTMINNNSGHYRPDGHQLYQALCELRDADVDLSQCKCTIITGEGHGFGDLDAEVVLGFQGNIPDNHQSRY